MNESVLAVEMTSKYQSIGEAEISGKISIDIEAIKEGFIETVGANRLPVLLAILSHMNKDGLAFPSQRTLSKITGQSINTVNKIINELLEIEFKGQNVLKRHLVSKGYKKQSVYFLGNAVMSFKEDTSELLNSIDEQDVELTADEALDAQAVLVHFLKVFESTFNAKYSVNWGRDKKLIKEKLLGKFEDDKTLLEVIDYAVEHYRDRWANPKYPVPTLFMLCSWLGSASYELIKQEREQEQYKVERMAKAEAHDESDKALDTLFNL